ncbi:endonuclease/exonuclease/phosphatase family protein [Pseudoxanthomonas wuyuanensis]|uniref:Metal-dependent hydrolase, endonuclease/exonuclease/phosphatase family n=1 Tax=Pseudoxanthomonas wuyuanensis TaxID=1073196 RepID=A0A286DA48_9GAMM|nr:endonuclease/exonuclease/phosphatase family protein [Pseudoxanthomonas wuyuanensis]KAF1720524.1 endonuclease [Pseudoxanthomonas wuyuanensis]SOD55535.1 Metal-dependent hydrolase, endonuclease/exonuclease/phosphatase family [Pseudoxanthomonas wuyuanensis]
MSTTSGIRRLRLLSANIQAGSSTRRYSDYVTRSWSHALPAGNKRGSLDTIAAMAGEHDIVGLQEADPGSLRSGFTNQTHYLAERAGFDYWSHQPNRNVARVAGSANGLLSRLEPVEVSDHALPGRISGRGVLMARFGDGREGLTVAVAHLSLGANSRRAQLAFIAELLSDHPNAVLMGDFNCLPDRPEMETLYKHTRLLPPQFCVPTFPSWRPQRAIDHILVSADLATHDARALPAANSDHLALAMNIDVPERALR